MTGYDRPIFSFKLVRMISASEVTTVQCYINSIIIIIIIIIMRCRSPANYRDVTYN